MKTLKFSLVFRTRKNADVFITLDENIYGIYNKRVLYLFTDVINIEHSRHFLTLDL